MFADAGNDCPIYAVLGDRYIFRLTGEQTGGAYALFDFHIPPGGGVPPHVHRREDEVFYVLEGELSFEVEGRRIALGPGMCLHAVKNVPHRFFNEGSQPVRAICMAVPAGIERFFMEIGTRLSGPDDVPPSDIAAQIPRVLETAPRYGIEILQPAPP